MSGGLRQGAVRRKRTSPALVQKDEDRSGRRMQHVGDRAGGLAVQVVTVKQLPAARTDASEKLRQQQLPRYFIEESIVGCCRTWRFSAEESVRGVGAAQVVSRRIADRTDEVGFN